MRCFVLFDAQGKPGRVYALSGPMLTLLQNTAIQFPILPHANAQAAIKAKEEATWRTPFVFTIVEKQLEVGRYFPSVARPIYGTPQGNLFNPQTNNEIEVAKNVLRELEILAQDLEHCFNVNSPFEDNSASYGIYYERIIYLACIGVEALFRKILEDNGIGAENANMAEFVKLNAHLRLDEYSVRLRRYPWLKAFAPFASWLVEKPSQSLEWYQAYNSLKHAKRKNEHQASMKNAILSATAYYILAFSVFGGDLFPGTFSYSFYFTFDSHPTWDVTQNYFKADDGSWSQMYLVL